MQKGDFESDSDLNHKNILTTVRELIEQTEMKHSESSHVNGIQHFIASKYGSTKQRDHKLNHLQGLNSSEPPLN